MTFELREQAACEQGRLAEPAYARWRTADGDVAATLHRAGGGYLVRFVDRARQVDARRRLRASGHAVPVR